MRSYFQCVHNYFLFVWRTLKENRLFWRYVSVFLQMFCWFVCRVHAQWHKHHFHGALMQALITHQPPSQVVLYNCYNILFFFLLFLLPIVVNKDVHSIGILALAHFSYRSCGSLTGRLLPSLGRSPPASYAHVSLRHPAHRRVLAGRHIALHTHHLQMLARCHLRSTAHSHGRSHKQHWGRAHRGNCSCS